LACLGSRPRLESRNWIGGSQSQSKSECGFGNGRRRNSYGWEVVLFGKHFASMYEGSMVGSGAAVFAVMGYVIANWKPDKEVGGQIRLNTTILATIFGE